MVKSMTGYGRAECKSALGVISVEIKSVNHKFLDISCKLPADLAVLEEGVRKFLQRDIKRGKVYVSVSIDNRFHKEPLINVDEEAVRRCYRLLNQIKKKLKLNDPIKIEHLLAFNGIIGCEKPVVNVEAQWPCVKTALNKALKKMVKTRSSEGQAISRNLRQHLNLISRRLRVIQNCLPGLARNYKKQLEGRIKKIGVDLSQARERIAAEVAIYLQKADITEEINRIRGHIAFTKKTLAGREPGGRKLDFICQELQREANTLGVKVPDSVISQQVVNIKAEIEKMREQVQNVE